MPSRQLPNFFRCQEQASVRPSGGAGTASAPGGCPWPGLGVQRRVRRSEPVGSSVAFMMRRSDTYVLYSKVEGAASVGERLVDQLLEARACVPALPEVERDEECRRQSGAGDADREFRGLVSHAVQQECGE